MYKSTLEENATKADVIKQVTSGSTVVTYLGFKKPGTYTTADAAWMIIRYTQNTAADTVTTVREYSNGNKAFNNVFDNYATTVNYSLLK